MAEVLYRKYRSQTFDELIGQEHITDILKSSIKKDQVSHAYLFVGSRGTGKTSSARILAKALNCTDIQKDGNPCNKCDRCKAITDGTFLDLIEIDAASNRGIDQIRDLKEKIEFSPAEGRYKVYIIDEVHMLTTEAFNALLKTLEEPPAHVIFILATTDVHKLPATILSRCQRYDFRLGTDKQVEGVISQAAKNEGVTLSKEALSILVQNAHGSYRDGLSLLDVVVSSQLDSEDATEVTAEEVQRSLGIPDSTMVYYMLEKLSEKDGKSALDLVGELDSKGVDLQQFVKFILIALREILVSKIDGSESEYSFAKELSQRDIMNMINLFLDADRKLKSSTIPTLVLEMVIAELIITENGSSQPTLIKKPPQKDLEKEKALGKGDVSKDTGVEDQGSESKSDLSFEAVENSWSDITSRIQKFNGHLYAFLKAAKVTEIEGDHLVLEVPFQFHKDRIEAPKSREAINEIFKEMFGSTLPIRCDVNETIQRKKPASADVVLKKIEKSAQSTSSPTEKPAPSNKPVQVKRRVSKKVEALFADV